jgi:hypothetical protein
VAMLSTLIEYSRRRRMLSEKVYEDEKEKEK